MAQTRTEGRAGTHRARSKWSGSGLHRDIPSRWVTGRSRCGRGPDGHWEGFAALGRSPAGSSEPLRVKASGPGEVVGRKEAAGRRIWWRGPRSR